MESPIFQTHRLFGFDEWCSAHRMGRVGAMLLPRFDVGKHLYSLCKAMSFHKSRQTLEALTESHLKSRFEVNGPVPPACCDRPALHDIALKVLTLTWGKDTLPFPFWRLLFRGGRSCILEHHRKKHMCDASSCRSRCLTWEQAFQRLWRPVRASFFAFRVPVDGGRNSS